MGVFHNLLGTLLSTFSIGARGARATLSAAGLTADRALALPDKDGTLATLGDVGGGGLDGWTGAGATATPNDIVPVASLTPSADETDVDAALCPKGAGALLSHVPDNTVVGGRKRGAWAVDLQRSRNSEYQVALGANSVVAGGSRNQAGGDYSVVAGGQSNYASTSGFVGGGQDNVANSTFTAIAGGRGNNATGTAGAISGGENNTAHSSASVGGGSRNNASGTYSTIPGGYAATVRGIYGAIAYASGYFTTYGDAQFMELVLRRQTTAAASRTLTTDNFNADDDNQAWLPNNSSYVVKAVVVAREATTGDSASWEFTAHIKRGASAAATQLVSPADVSQIAVDAGAAAWGITVDADTVNGALQINVTGEDAKTIKWVAHLHSCVQVLG